MVSSSCTAKDCTTNHMSYVPLLFLSFVHEWSWNYVHKCFIKYEIPHRGHPNSMPILLPMQIKPLYIILHYVQNIINFCFAMESSKWILGTMKLIFKHILLWLQIAYKPLSLLLRPICAALSRRNPYPV